MIKNKQVLKDVQEIMKIGTDGMLYVQLATVLNENDTNINTKDIKNAIALIANLVRILEKLR